MVRPQSPTIKIDGTELEDAWYDDLDEVAVDLELRVTGRAEIRFDDPVFDHAEKALFTMGAEVTILFPPHDTGEPVLVFTGEVAAVEVTQPAGARASFVVTAYDWTHRLARTPEVTASLDKTYSEIVTALTEGKETAITATTLKLPYHLQRGTALEVLDECADRTGFDWWVDEKGVLQYDKPGSGETLEVELGETLLAFSARLSAFAPSTVEVRGWDRDGQQVVTSTGTGLTRPGTASTFEGAYDTTAFGETVFKLTSDETSGVIAEAKDLADDQLAKRVESALAFTGELVGTPALHLRSMLKVADAGALSGEYLVTGVEHLFRSTDGLTTRFRTGRRTPAMLVDLFGRDTSPPATDLTTGTVTDVDAKDHVGRVKVQFPVLDDTVESAWARVATMGGGSDRGFSFLPEVGDEVLIGFERADRRYPLVLGGLLGDMHAGPTVVADEKIVSRRLRSGAGNEMLFEDTEGKPVIKFTLGDEKKSLEFNVDGITMVSDKVVTIEVGESKLVIDPAKGVSVDSDQPISITTQKNLTLESKMQVSITAGTGMVLDGGTTAALKGKTVNVEATGPVAVSGKPVKVN